MPPPENPALRAALDLRKRGYSVIPIRPSSKLPALTEWLSYQSEAADEEQIGRWFSNSPKNNVAIVTGSVSGGLVVLDVDNNDKVNGAETLANLVMQYGMSLPDTASVRTPGGGIHYYFRYPNGVKISNSSSTIGAGLDIRAEGGYVLCPPSINGTGKPYQWVERQGENTIADVPEFLLDIIRSPRTLEDSDRIRKVVDNTGEFDAFGRRVDGRENRAMELVSGAFYGLLRITGSAPPLDVLYREVASSYFAELQVMTPDKREALDRENPKRGPAMLEEKCRYILRRYAEGRLDEPRLPSSGAPDEEGGKVGGAEKPHYSDAPGHSFDESDKPIPAATLVGEPPAQRWFVEDWIPAHCVTSLYGDGGVGKSLLAQQLATCIATGRTWLGLDVRKANALCLSCEDDKNELHRRQTKINSAYQCSSQDLSNLYLWPRIGKDNLLVNWTQGMPVRTGFFYYLKDTVVENKIEFLVLDTIPDLFGGAENDRVQVNYFAKAVLGELVDETGVTILLLGHPPKTQADGTGHSYSGSTAWNGVVRARYSMSREVEEGLTDQRTLTCYKSNYSDSILNEIELVYGSGVFDLAGGDDAVAAIAYRTQVKRLLDEVGRARDLNTPYVSQRGHPRGLAMHMMRLCKSKEDKQHMAKAIKEAEREGWIAVTRSRPYGYEVMRTPDFTATN